MFGGLHEGLCKIVSDGLYAAGESGVDEGLCEMVSERLCCVLQVNLERMMDEGCVRWCLMGWAVCCRSGVDEGLCKIVSDGLGWAVFCRRIWRESGRRSLSVCNFWQSTSTTWPAATATLATTKGERSCTRR